MATRHVFFRRMQQIFDLSDEHSPIVKTLQKNSLAATRCRIDFPFGAMTNPFPREDAYMIVIQILGKNSRELWLDGRPIKTEPLHAGGVVFQDLRRSPQFYFNDPLDSVNYFLPRKTLNAIADDAEAPRISDLKFTRRRRHGSRRAGAYAITFASVRHTRASLPALRGSYQPGPGCSYRPDIWRREKRRPSPARRSRRMAGTARERPDERKSSWRYFYRGHRARMLAIGGTFCSRVSAFYRAIAAPVAASAPD